MLANKNIKWVVVADSSKANIYQTTSKINNLELYKSLHSEDARTHSKDLGSDHPGGVFERNTPEARVDIQAKEKLNFAHEIADLLNHASTNYKFNQLILIASPHFLGDLRKLISQQTAKLITQEINKNLTNLKEEEIVAHIWQ